jgi:hypothetical protein
LWHKFSQNNIKPAKSNPRKNMTEVEKFIKKLHRLEKSGDLEVEHLLKALKIPDPALIEPLREMSRQYDWQPMNDDLVVPMAAWVDAICIYLEGGVAGLIKAINRPKQFFGIVFGTIEELPPHEALDAFLQLGEEFARGIPPKKKSFAKCYIYTLMNFSCGIKSQKIGARAHDAFVPILKGLIAATIGTKDENMAEYATICFEALGDTSDTEYLKSLAFNEKRYKNIGKTVAKKDNEKI